MAGTNRRLIVSSTGFPGTNATWRFIQEAWSEPLKALALLAGDKTILSGVVIVGQNVSNGYVVFDGEILPFVGGQLQQMCSIQEDVETATYDADNNNDGQQDVFPVFRTRQVVFGTAGLTPFAFADLTRLSSLKQLQPIGSIIMWSGAIADIPSGWQLCDGTNNTPDLRNRFIVGAGDEYNINANAGNNNIQLQTANLPSFQAGGSTSDAGNHSHAYKDSFFIEGFPQGDVPGTFGDYVGNNKQGARGDNDNRYIWWRNGTTNAGGNHIHGVSVSFNGQSQPIDIRPKYYALAFIIYKG
jgi:microcystin-dependent protein